MSIPILRIRDADGRIATIPAIKGEKGDRGADGTVSFDQLTDEQKESLKGETGAVGPAGPQGLQGEKGDKGDQGPQGIQGEKGDAGATPDPNDWISQVYQPESSLAMSGSAVAEALGTKFLYGTGDPPEDAAVGTFYIQLEE